MLLHLQETGVEMNLKILFDNVLTHGICPHST